MEKREVKSTVDARQGDRRRMNLRVLTLSIVAVIVLFAVVYALGFSFGT